MNPITLLLSRVVATSRSPRSAPGASSRGSAPKALSLPTCLLAVAAFSPLNAEAQDGYDVLAVENAFRLGQTHESTLNDLIRRIPIQSRERERSLAGLSAVQEQALLHERRMSGEGLPPALQSGFADNYRSILNAVINERISRQEGRELLDRHRVILSEAFCWIQRNGIGVESIDEIGRVLVMEQDQITSRLRPLAEYCGCDVRTPLINGQQLWIEEILLLGGQCRHLSIAEIGKIARLAQRLENFEGFYKRDGRLTDRERSELHRRMIEIHRVTIEAFES